MAFYEVRFPPEISHGSVMGPGHNTAIVETDSGQEERVGRWSGARLFYDAANGVKKRSQMAVVLEFVRSMRGSLHGFRWKDWSDFSTSPDHQALVPETMTDEIFGVGDGTTKVFFLRKSYTTAPAPTLTRLINKPVQGTLLIAVNGVLQTEGTAYTVNYATGAVGFATAPAAGLNITWGGQFDVPVRFGKELDALLSIRFDAHDVRANDSIPVIELINELPVDDEFNYRGGKTVNPMAADLTLAPNDPLAWALVPTAARTVTLPNAQLLSAGGIWFTLHNFAAFTITVQDHLANLIGTITNGQCLTLIILPDVTGTNQWVGY